MGVVGSTSFIYTHLNEMKHKLPSHGLISMHISNIFDIGYAEGVFVRGRGDNHDPELSPLNRSSNGVECRDVGMSCIYTTKITRHLFIVVVGEVQGGATGGAFPSSGPGPWRVVTYRHKRERG